MTLADKFTSTRFILAPVFFIIYLLPGYFIPFFSVIWPSIEKNSLFVNTSWAVPVLWIIFVFSEITDMLDGMIARKQREVSDFGMLFDPFADTLTQITYFLCFVLDGIFPPLLFLVVLYREFSILFVRNLMLKKGVTLGARISGKVKTVSYILAGALALLASSIVRLGFNGEFYKWVLMAARAVFVVSVIIAVLSFIDYLLVFLKTSENN